MTAAARSIRQGLNKAGDVAATVRLAALIAYELLKYVALDLLRPRKRTAAA